MQHTRRIHPEDLMEVGVAAEAILVVSLAAVLGFLLAFLRAMS
jgi:hypothetical protein